MNTQFVYIDSISKLDPSKATVYDLNKRYIDGDGNMFGLKYNRDTKKIEVIRLLRTSMQHARKKKKKMHYFRQNNRNRLTVAIRRLEAHDTQLLAFT